jgi:tetratricopeptide (TPR) repeat protein
MNQSERLQMKQSLLRRFRPLMVLFIGTWLIFSVDQPLSGAGNNHREKNAKPRAVVEKIRTVVPLHQRISDEEAMRTLAILLAESPGTRSEAEVWWRRLTSAPAASLADQLSFLNVLMEQNRFFESEPLLKKALRVAPDHPELLFLQGHLFWKTQRLAEAIEVFEERVKRVPASATAWIDLSTALLANHQPERAAILARLGIAQLSSDPWELHEILGDALQGTRQWNDALQAFAAARERLGDPVPPDDDSPGPRNRLSRKIALALSYQGRDPEAEQFLKAFQQKFPRDLEVGIELARVLQRGGRYQEAVDLLDTYRDENASEKNFLAELADAHLAMGHARQCRDLYESLLGSVSPEEKLPLKRRWANRLQQFGDFQQAITILLSIVQNEIDVIPDRLALAWALASIERYEEATREYQTVLGQEPANREATLGMAKVAMLAKDFSGACHWARQAAKADPDDPEAGLLLAEGLIMLFQVPEAQTILQKLVQSPALSADDLRRLIPLFNKMPRAAPMVVEGKSLVLGKLGQFPIGKTEKRFWEEHAAPTFFPALLQPGAETPFELAFLGDLYAGIASSSAAITLYQAALNQDPDLLVTSLNLAVQLGAVRRFPEALHILDAVLRDVPGHWKAQLLRARILAWSGEYAAAIRQFETLSRTDPTNPVPVKEMARAAFWGKRQREGHQAYQRFLEPSVDALVRNELLDTGSASETLRILDSTVSSRPYSAYEALEHWCSAGQSPDAGMDGTKRILQRYLHVYKIQKAIFLERLGKEQVWFGKGRRALKSFARLLQHAPGNQEARFDLSQLECSLGLSDRERESYRSLLHIDPFHNLVRSAQHSLQSRSQPLLRFEYEQTRETGRGQLAQMFRQGWRVSGSMALTPRWWVTVGENRWLYHPGIWGGEFKARGLSMQLRGVVNAWTRVEAGMTQKQFDANRQFPQQSLKDRSSGFVNATFNLRDRADVTLGFDRSDVFVNEIGLRDGIQADSRWISLAVPFFRKFSVLGRWSGVEYSDHNQAHRLFWQAGYALTDHPEIFKLILSGENIRTDRRTRYVFRNGSLINIVHPYWTPSSYTNQTATIEYYRDFSKLQICQADHSFLDLRCSLSNDSLHNPARRVEWTWHLEFRQRWTFEIRGSWHDSADWKEKAMAMKLERHF